MVAVVQVKNFLQTEYAGDLEFIVFVCQHRVSNLARPGRIVVGHEDQVTGVTFIQKLCHGYCGENGNIVRVRLNCSQNFAAMRLSRDSSLDDKVPVARKVGWLL